MGAMGVISLWLFAYLLTCGMRIWAVCLNASTQVRRSLRIFSRSSGQSLAWPTCISMSRKSATWLLISTMSCKCKANDLIYAGNVGMQSFNTKFMLNLCRALSIGPFKLHIIQFNLCTAEAAAVRVARAAGAGAGAAASEPSVYKTAGATIFLGYLPETSCSCCLSCCCCCCWRFCCWFLFWPFYGSFASLRRGRQCRQINRAIEPNFLAFGQIVLIKIKMPNNAKSLKRKRKRPRLTRLSVFPLFISPTVRRPFYDQTYDRHASI